MIQKQLHLVPTLLEFFLICGSTSFGSFTVCEPDRSAKNVRLKPSTLSGIAFLDVLSYSGRIDTLSTITALSDGLGATLDNFNVTNFGITEAIIFSSIKFFNELIFVCKDFLYKFIVTFSRVRIA